MSKLMKTEWQTQILEEDHDVIEVIACRQAGKTLLGLMWAEKDCDQLIVLSKNPVHIRSYIKKLEEEFKLDLPPVKVLSNLMQLQKVYTHPKTKTKILVDEYFELGITINQIDKTLRHESYKVMFVGTRTELNQNFQIPYSKQYMVDALRLVNEGIMEPETLIGIMKHSNEEEFEINFMSPFSN